MLSQLATTTIPIILSRCRSEQLAPFLTVLILELRCGEVIPSPFCDVIHPFLLLAASSSWSFHCAWGIVSANPDDLVMWPYHCNDLLLNIAESFQFTALCVVLYWHCLLGHMIFVADAQDLSEAWHFHGLNCLF